MKIATIVCLLALVVPSIRAGEAQLEAVADATVLMDTPDANKGGDAGVWAFAGPPGHISDAAKSCLRFQLDSITSKIRNVSFVATYPSKLARSGEVWLLPGSPEWEEDSITWENAPQNDTASRCLLLDGIKLGVMNGGPSGDEITLEFSDDTAKSALIKALETPPHRVTLVLVQSPYTNASIFTVASREHPSYPPARLILETTTGAVKSER